MQDDTPILSQDLAYEAAETACHGYLAMPGGAGPVPGVLVAHAFGGIGDFERRQADRLARQGYAALALDYYGNGWQAGSREEAAERMAELNADRPLLLQRMQAALKALARLREVDETRLGAMGFCFGGKAVLDLARSGAAFQAGASLHGVYDAPPSGSQDMQAALLVLHGWDDPLAPPQAVTALAEELTLHCPDWQILGFGHTGHAFTNPAVSAAAPGFGYSETAAPRAFAALDRFLAEKLA
ncbi:dienelactone hydrolase family protein [Pseudooceanicola sp. HF7]|uniref:dienelactone hydrolase family protein n=1 Tax=Pseudooceanicola sp. HF7 TaxID=2721560 RepID=UPI0014308F55|nr:dienelactone hydrolase family protein [Pseudooceanicola sp. HF7]NIZ11663.1 dienelactone hydrolase family protein [Pseudooceanicola sp. HF7]